MSQIYQAPEPTGPQKLEPPVAPTKKEIRANNKASKKAARKEAKKDAKERVQNRLGQGKNVDASKIAEKTGISEKRAQKIINKSTPQYTETKLYPEVSFEDDNEKLYPEAKFSGGPRMAGAALDADTPAAAEASESVKKAAAKGKSGESESGQQYYSDGKLVDMGAPNRDKPSKDNNPYTNKNIEDFDLAAGGAGAKKGTNRLSAQDIKGLNEQGGFSKQEIVDYAESHDFGDGPGASGGKAQALLGKYKDAIANNDAKKDKKKDKETPVVEDVRLGGEEEETPTPTPTPTPEQKPVVDAVQTGENNFINTGKMIGNINQGADFSVNIGGDASDNMQNAVSYSAINDNAFARSQSQMNGLTRASQAVEAANEQTGAAQDIANTDFTTRLNSLYLGAKGTQARTQLYGDMFKFEAPEWMQPEPGKKPKDKTKKIADMYND